MAYIFANNPISMTNSWIYYGDVLETTSSSLVIRDGLNTAFYTGSGFVYDGLYVVGGTLFGYEEYYDGDLTVRVELQISAALVDDYMFGNDFAGLSRIILAGNDDIVGSTGNDTLLGFAGSDVFVENGGYNIIDGGSGVDYLDVYGSSNQYQLTFLNDFIRVDRFDGSLENDLYSVERVVFDNGTLALDYDGNAGQGYRIYQAAFDRTPDTAGLDYWVNQIDNGVSILQVAAGFVQSAEFRSVYGSNPSDADFIDKLYEDVLGREGETGGFNYWFDQMQQGASRAYVLASFSESRENVLGVLPEIENGIWLG